MEVLTPRRPVEEIDRELQRYVEMGASAEAIDILLDQRSASENQCTER